MITEINNIDQLKNVFLNTQQALEGKLILDRYIDTFQNEKLGHLLRDHRQNRVTREDEIKERDSIDELLEYFNALCLGRISGFISESELENESPFILRYLGHPSVIPYYTRYYPLHLPQLLYESVRNDKLLVLNESSNNRTSKFNTFITLNHAFNDPELSFFLWVLDDGSYGQKNADDLHFILQNSERTIRLLAKGKKDTLSILLRGFFKFSEFALSFQSFLTTMNDSPFQQSAYWHFYQYWFKNFRETITIGVKKSMIALKNSTSYSSAAPDDNALKLLDTRINEVADDIRIVFDHTLFAGNLDELARKTFNLNWSN